MELTDEQIEAIKVPGDPKNLLEKKKGEFDQKKKEAAEETARLQAEALAKAMQKAQQQPQSPPAPPRRPAGFVPPGSTVSGGEVKRPEDDKVNPNNVLDLRK